MSHILLGALLGALTGAAFGAFGRGVWRWASLSAAIVVVAVTSWIIATSEPTHVGAFTGLAAFVAGGVAFVGTELGLERREQRERLARARASRDGTSAPAPRDD